MAKNQNTIIVKSKSAKGFRRAGLAFTREGIELDPSKLKKGQLESILSEPNLVVVGEVPTHEEADLCYRVLKAFEHQGAQIEPAVEGQAPVFIQLSAAAAELLASDGFISTADDDVTLPPDLKKAGKAKAGK